MGAPEHARNQVGKLLARVITVGRYLTTGHDRFGNAPRKGSCGAGFVALNQRFEISP